MKLFCLLSACAASVLSGCAPAVYVIDRHTIHEEEASGDWPDLYDAFLIKEKRKGVTFFQRQEVDSSQKRSWNVLNGDFTNE